MERNPEVYRPAKKDDAYHSVAYEWWYFDGILDNGYKVRTQWFYGNLTTLNPDERSITFMIHDPDGKAKVVNLRFPLSETSASTETCDVKMGDNHMHGAFPRYEWNFHSGGIGGDLIYECTTQGVREPPNGVHLGRSQEPATAKYIGWVIHPRSRISGKLILDGKEMTVSGEGYHDHNWGNCHINELYDHWFWAWIYLPDHTFVLWEGQQSEKFGNQRFKRLWALKGEKLFDYLKDDIYTDTSDVVADPATGVIYPRTLVLTIDSNRIRGTVTQRFKHFIQAPRPPAAGRRSKYLCWLSDCDVKLEVDDEKIITTTQNIIDWPVW